jgi:RNA polymerase sigma-70 factor (ECF subfamily)
MDHLDDQDIIAAVLNGDVNTYRVLVERYQKPIFNLMCRMTNSHADALDLAQETFVTAYEKLDHFKNGSRFFPWLYTIGINRARNFLRKRNVEKRSLSETWEEFLTPGCFVPSAEKTDPLDVHCLQQALLQLPFEYREAVMLHYREGFSMEEIARSLQLSVSGAKMRVHRGLEKLRHIIHGDGEGAEKGGTDVG